MATTEDCSVVQLEGKRIVQNSDEHYNLLVVVSVGYHVNPRRGEECLRWAIQRGLVLGVGRFFWIEPDSKLQSTIKRNKVAIVGFLLIFVSQNKGMIPKSFEEWRRCIVVDCGVELTASFIEERLLVFGNRQHPETMKFVALYGENHLNNVVNWLNASR